MFYFNPPVGDYDPKTGILYYVKHSTDKELVKLRKESLTHADMYPIRLIVFKENSLLLFQMNREYFKTRHVLNLWALRGIIIQSPIQRICAMLCLQHVTDVTTNYLCPT